MLFKLAGNKKEKQRSTSFCKNDNCNELNTVDNLGSYINSFLQRAKENGVDPETIEQFKKSTWVELGPNDKLVLGQ